MKIFNGFLVILFIYSSIVSCNGQDEGSEIIKDNDIEVAVLDTILKYEPIESKIEILDSIIIDSSIFLFKEVVTDEISVKQFFQFENSINVYSYRTRELWICVDEKEPIIIDKNSFIENVSLEEINIHYITFFEFKNYTDNIALFNTRMCLPDSDSCYDFEIKLNVLTLKVEIELIEY